MSQQHFREDESLRSQRMTEGETKAVIDLWQQERTEGGGLTTSPAVPDVAEGLDVSVEDVQRLLQQVRARRLAEQQRLAHDQYELELERMRLAEEERQLAEVQRQRAELQRDRAERQRQAEWDGSETRRLDPPQYLRLTRSLPLARVIRPPSAEEMAEVGRIDARLKAEWWRFGRRLIVFLAVLGVLIHVCGWFFR